MLPFGLENETLVPIPGLSYYAVAYPQSDSAAKTVSCEAAWIGTLLATCTVAIDSRIAGSCYSTFGAIFVSLHAR
jgi:hypothetical protein